MSSQWNMRVYDNKSDLKEALWRAPFVAVDAKGVRTRMRALPLGAAVKEFPEVSCAIVRSRIDIGGLGVVATSTIPAHTFIMEYGGLLSTERRDNDWDYFIETKGQTSFFLVAEEQNSLAHYVNSSGVPNCIYVCEKKNGQYKVGVASLRPIKAGEEITCEYMEDYKDMKCHERASLVIRTVHPPPLGKKKDRGVILGIYGPKKLRYLNLKWTATPQEGKACWSVQSESVQCELAYFWKKQQNLSESMWLAETRPSFVGKKDKQRKILVEQTFTQKPALGRYNLVQDMFIAQSIALRVVELGAKFDFCNGDTSYCECDGKVRHESGLNKRASIWEEDLDELLPDTPASLEEKEQEESKDVFEAAEALMTGRKRKESPNPPSPATPVTGKDNRLYQKFQGLLERVEKRIKAEVVLAFDDDLENIFKEAYNELELL